MHPNPPRDYVYHTSCVNSTAELIDEMREQELEITYETMLAHADGLRDWAKQMGYSLRSDAGLTLATDWGVSFHRSFYAGAPCYYLVHSGIEYIWIKKGLEDEVAKEEETARRRGSRSTTSMLARDYIPGGTSSWSCVPGQHLCPETGDCVDIGSGSGQGVRRLRKDNPYVAKGPIVERVVQVPLIDRVTGTRNQYHGTVEDLAALLDPVLILPDDPRAPEYSKETLVKKRMPSLVFPHHIIDKGDGIGLASIFTLTTKMLCPSFSLPAGPIEHGGTCMMSVAKKLMEPPEFYICNSCYARHGRYYFDSMMLKQGILRWWTEKMIVEDPTFFTDAIVASLQEFHSTGPGTSESSAMMRYVKMEESKVKHKTKPDLSISGSYFRIHDSGDFGWKGPRFTARYYQAWIDIANSFSNIMFWAPTRCHAIRPVLEIFRAKIRPRNFILRPSALHFHDAPPRVTGLDGGTTCIYGEVQDPYELVDHDCPASRYHSTCDTEGCRLCWDNPTLTVNYEPHPRRTKQIKALREYLDANA